jgi:hypothetical protein
MFHLKNKIITKIAVFAVIALVILWLLPVGLVSAEGTDETPTGTTVETTAPETTAPETTAPETTAPETTAPETTAPETTAPETTAPETTAPETTLLPDTTPPAITLNGDSTVKVELGSTYSDAGATATDDVDGNLTDSIKIDKSAVNTAVLGSYTVTYNVSDSSGNTAAEVTRTVNVIPIGSLVLLSPSLSTDKEDYGPEETVIITGTGFAPNAIYTIVVVRPDGSIVLGDGSFTPGSDKILTDATTGSFTYNYILDGILGTYKVKAVDSEGNVVATTSFTDATTITINVTKKIYMPDGVTEDPTDTTSFTIRCWRLNLSGTQQVGVDTTIVHNQTVSFTSTVTWGGIFWIEEVSNSNYVPSFTPASLVPGSWTSGTITKTSTGTIAFTAKNTQGTTTLRIKKEVYDINGTPVTPALGDTKTFNIELWQTFLSIPISKIADVPLKNGEISSPITVSPNVGYCVKEVSDPGYDTSYDPSGLAGYSGILTPAPGSSDKIFTVKNTQKAGTISANKQDTLGSSLAGAQIGLYANQGDPVAIQTVASTSGSPNVVFTNVPSGGSTGITYYIHEISAPLGYIADGAWYPVTISDSNLNPVLETPIVNTGNGTIILYKQDNKGNNLGGAEFGLYSSNDETATPLTTATSQAGTGEVTFEHLVYGTYYIREISAPFGFLVDENWYEVILTPENTPYTIQTPIIDIPGGTITVTKNVIAPDGKTDVDDAKEFTITLEKKDGSGNWVAVKSVKIKEGTPIVFSVPLNISYRVVETADAKYTETGNTGEVILCEPGQNQNICITNKQHYALIVMGKIIYEWNSFLPNLITDDDHIFFTKLEGGHASLIEWHPIATKIPTAFLVWPGTYTVFEKPDVNYNDNGQPVIISGFDLSDFNLGDLGDISNLISILFSNLIGGGGLSQEITVEGGDITPLIIANKYTPQVGTVTVTKDVVRPDKCTQVSDPKEFSVKLQRLELTLPDILGSLNLGNLTNIANLSDLMNILDLTQLTNLSNLIGWVDVGTPQNVSEGNPVTFSGVEKDHIYRVVETQVPGYLQICGMIPFYFAPDDTNEQIDIINMQEPIIVKVSKNIIAPDGSDVSDCHPFWVKLESEDVGGSGTFPHLISENNPTYFVVWPGTYSVFECAENCYTRVDEIGKFTVGLGDGSLCDPVELTVINQQNPGVIIITKNGLLGNDQAIFTLCDKDGNPISSQTPITLGEGGSDVWKNLNWGKYTVIESYPTANNNNYGTPTFNPPGPYEIGCGDCWCNLTQNITVTNHDPTPKTAQINVNKIVNGTPNSADFVFTVEDGFGPTSFTLPGAGGGPHVVTVEVGKTYTISEEVPWSDWLLPLISTDIPGATINPVSVTFSVVDGNDIDAIDGKSIDFTNTRKTCWVEFIKTVDGVEPADGSYGFAFTGTPDVFTLDVTPYRLPLEVECGVEYTITEDSLPAGFDLNDITWTGDFSMFVKDIANKTFTFIVECENNNTDGEVGAFTVATGEVIDPVEPVIDHTITFDNYRIPSSKRGSIEIQKVPAVSGVGFTLFKSDGTTVAAAEEFTDGSGKVTFSGLPYGTYIVRETTGIPGYSLAADQSVTINSGNVATVISLTFTNTPTTGGGITVAGLTTPGFIQVLAFTGMDPIIPISGGSAVIGGLAMLLATLRRKRNKK